VKDAIVKAGDISTIKISVEVKDEYHIQANQVKDESLIPTKLELSSTDKFIMKGIKYPAPKKFKLEGTDTYLDVLDGKFEIRTFVNSQKQLPKGIYILNAKLSYQACNSKQCLFPRSVEFPIKIEVR
jgi:hypothetical protein